MMTIRSMVMLALGAMALLGLVVGQVVLAVLGMDGVGSVVAAVEFLVVFGVILKCVGMIEETW